MDKLPPTSSSSSSSQRLPSFRDITPIQNALNKAKVFNQKTYVPNLFVPRNVQPKVNAADKKLSDTPIKTEPTSRENRRPRHEQKLLAPVETLAPVSNTARNTLCAKSKFKINDANVSAKQNIFIDRNAIKKVFKKELPGKFEGVSSAPLQDLPVSIPESRSDPAFGTVKNINPLLSSILEFDAGESPLFLLKTPKYIPAVLDDSKSHAKIHDLPEGQIGKLQILKSGRLRLLLGDCKFWLHKGTNVDFREELATVETDTETKSGEIISLGEIKERIMVVPDMITKLKS